ncbi:hypothetical protein [Paraburkholderia sp. PGU19]|uniref:hypothetical protein n=1 Tax=Paraburkholderia sp. PGU19 TaxID=2735434 RepID=UPI0015DAFE1A|nr:hypothetical protein [Paraburkholderia sp. PGU19]
MNQPIEGRFCGMGEQRQLATPEPHAVRIAHALFDPSILDETNFAASAAKTWANEQTHDRCSWLHKTFCSRHPGEASNERKTLYAPHHS